MNANISNAGRQFLGILKGLQIDGREPVRPQMAVFAHGPDGIPRHWKVPDEVTEGLPRFRMNPVPNYLIHAEAMVEMTGEELELAKAETCTLGLAEVVDGEECAIIRYRRPDGKIISTEETDSHYLKTQADGIPVSCVRLGRTIPAYRLTAAGLRLLTESDIPANADEPTWPVYPWGDSAERLPRDAGFIAVIRHSIPNWDGTNWSVIRERLLDRGRPESWFASASLLDIQMAFQPVGSTTETAISGAVLAAPSRPAGLWCESKPQKYGLHLNAPEGKPMFPPPPESVQRNSQGEVPTIREQDDSQHDDTTLPPNQKAGQADGIAQDPNKSACLRDGHAIVLEALKKLEATGRDNRKPAREIAKAAVGEGDENKVKEPLADLARWGYVKSMQGRNGGSWITKGGKAALKAYRAAGKE